MTKFPGISLSLTGDFVDEMETFRDDAPIDETNPDSPQTGRIGNRVNGWMSLGMNFRISEISGTGAYVNLRCSNLFPYYGFNTPKLASKYKI